MHVLLYCNIYNSGYLKSEVIQKNNILRFKFTSKTEQFMNPDCISTYFSGSISHSAKRKCLY